MGCDGGTIPRRDELVRLKKKPEQKDKDAEREFRWLHCALNQQRLQEPIVMCGLGRLYSKQNVIEQLLERDKMPESAKHIKSMKDIKQLNLTPNPAFTEEDKTEGLLDTRHAPYICKLIGLEMSGKFRFVALWSCGCVMSERALKEIKSSSSGTCPLCQQQFSVEDVIVLNGSDEDLELMKVKIEMRQAKKKAAKKDKKDKKTKVNDVNLEETKTLTESLEVPSTSKSETRTSSNNCVNLEETNEPKTLTESLEVPSTSKSETKTETKTDNNSNSTLNGISSSSSLKSSRIKIVANPKRLGVTSGALEDPALKRLKTDYSVAKDPKASDVYKSLFTSHKSEQEQTRAHWVTYNPFYN